MENKREKEYRPNSLDQITNLYGGERERAHNTLQFSNESIRLPLSGSNRQVLLCVFISNFDMGNHD